MAEPQVAFFLSFHSFNTNLRTTMQISAPLPLPQPTLQYNNKTTHTV